MSRSLCRFEGTRRKRVVQTAKEARYSPMPTGVPVKTFEALVIVRGKVIHARDKGNAISRAALTDSVIGQSWIGQFRIAAQV